MRVDRAVRRLYARITGEPFARLSGSLHPFKRINALVTAANEAQASGIDAEKDAAVAALNAYKSRGHGKNKGMQRTILGNWNQERTKFSQRQCYAEGKR